MAEIELYQQMMNKDPSSQAFIYLAEAYLEREMYEEAIEVCANGLRLRPHDLRGRVILGLSCLRTGALDRAEAELQKAREMLEINAVTFQALAELYDQKGDAEQAVRYREVFEVIHPSEAPAPEAEVTEPDIEVEPEEVSDEEPKAAATITMAELYIQQGHLYEAVGVYQQILENEPENVEAQNKLADLEKEINEAQKAHRLLSILERWQSRLKDQVNSPSLSPSSEAMGIDLEGLSAFVKKHTEGLRSS